MELYTLLHNRFHLRRLTCLLSATLALSGACRLKGGEADVSDRGSDTMPHATSTKPIGGLARSCILTEAWKLRLSFDASLMPSESRESATTAESAWSPNVITDVAMSGDRVAVLDGQQDRVTIFDSLLAIIATAGREGAGPSEMNRPGAIAGTPDGRFWIADQGNGRLLTIGPGSNIEPAGRLPAKALLSGMAIDDGSAYYSSDVLAGMIDRGPLGIVAAFGDIGSAETRPVLDLKSNSALAESLLVLPGPNPFRVVRSGGYTLIVASAAGMVLVYDGTDRVGTAKVCMPMELREAYRAQMARDRNSGAGPQSQQSQPLVTDAMIANDTLFVVGPLPDHEDRFHIDLFTLAGAPIGSATAQLRGAEMPEKVRFWAGESRLLGFGVEGTLMSISSRRVPR